MQHLATITSWLRKNAKPFGAGCAAMIAILTSVFLWRQPSPSALGTEQTLASTTRASTTSAPERFGFAMTWLQHARRASDDAPSPTPPTISAQSKASASEIAARFSPDTQSTQLREEQVLTQQQSNSRFASQREASPIPPSLATPTDMPTDPTGNTANTVRPFATTVVRQGRSEPVALPADATAKTSVRVDLVRDKLGSVRAAFPFDVNYDSPTPARGMVVVGQLPVGVAFTSGNRTPEGVWQLAIADLKFTQLVVGPGAPDAFILTIIHLDPQGLVVNGVDVAVSVTSAVPQSLANQTRQTVSQRTKLATAARSRVTKSVASYRKSAAPVEIQSAPLKPRSSLTPPKPSPANQPAQVAAFDQSLSFTYPFVEGPPAKVSDRKRPNTDRPNTDPRRSATSQRHKPATAYIRAG
jgi:hypothetical protein